MIKTIKEKRRDKDSRLPYYDYIEYLVILFLMFIPLSNVGNLVRLGVTCVLLIRRLNKNNFQLHIQGNLDKAIVFIFIGFISSLIVVVIVDKSFDFTHWMHEVERMIFCILLLLLVPQINVPFKFVYRSSVAIFLFHMGIQIIQRFSLFNINEWIIRVYAVNSDTKSVLENAMYLNGSFRSGSIFLNANIYMIIPCSILCIVLQHNIRGGNKLINYSLCILSLFSMLLTGSRTTLGVSTVIIVIYLLSNKTITIKEKLLVLFVSLLFILLLAYRFDFLNTYRVFNISNGLEKSLFVKFNLFKEYLYNAHPLYYIMGCLGSKLSTIQIDAEWGYVFQFYGIFGLLWYYYLNFNNGIKCNTRLTFLCISTKIMIFLIAITTTIVLCMPIYPFVCLITLSNIEDEKIN